MAFDGIVARAIAKELNDKLVLNKINKIYQPDKQDLVFQLHGGGEQKKLYISCNSNRAGMYITHDSFTNPQHPPNFCMVLRKHLQGGKIISIKQVGTERILEIAIESFNEMGDNLVKLLNVEIMGKHSNITLVNQSNMRIIDSIKHISIEMSRTRQILPGLPYHYPDAKGKIPFDNVDLPIIKGMLADHFGDCFDNRANDESQVANMLSSKFQGISPKMAEEICSSCFQEKECLATSIYNSLNKISKICDDGDFHPIVYVNEKDVPVDFHVFPISQYTYCYREIAFPSISQTIHFYYEKREISNRMLQKSASIRKTLSTGLKKQYLKKQRLLEDIDIAKESHIYRLYGELLTANLHNIQRATSKVELLNYYDNSYVDIPLDSRYSPSKNAQNYYKKYEKSKRALVEKKQQLEETLSLIEYLESSQLFLENATSVEEINHLKGELQIHGYGTANPRIQRKKEKKLHSNKRIFSPITYTLHHGENSYRVLVGKNNFENDHLTFKLSGKKDIWFHTKDIPGSHVILFTEGRQIPEDIIHEASSIAAYHSKGVNSSNVPVDYTQVRHVKKPKGGKPGMVIFVDNKTVYANPSIPQLKPL